MIYGIEETARELSQAVRNRRLALFCGAGVSKGSGLPTAKEFMGDQGLGSLPWERASTVLTNQKSFKYKFKQKFGDKSLKPSRVHRLLAALDAPYYVTTNYDLLLEQALADIKSVAVAGIGTVKSEGDLPGIYDHRNLVIKLHGDVENDQLLIFDSSQYMDRWRSPNLVDALVSHLFATHSILFVGYSLTDAHIVSIIEEENQRDGLVTPPKYLIVESLDRQMEQYLEAINVHPVLVAGDGEDFEAGVRHLLFRLWEQQHDHGTYTQLLEREQSHPLALLNRAIVCKQNGDTDGAHALLKELFKGDLDEIMHLDSLPNFLWLTVSVHDKREDWRKLRELDEETIDGIFNKLRGKIPDSIHRALQAEYQASMAIALLREGSYEEALARSEIAIGSTCTSTASRALQILSANTYVTHAIALLGMWRLDERKAETIERAKEDLVRAREIFDLHGDMGTPHESHYLGLYFGTRAFVDLADLESGPVHETDYLKILGSSNRAHSPEKRRTGFGFVAGLYCDAYCHYRAAERITNPAQSREYFRAAATRLEKLDFEIKNYQKRDALKAYELGTRLIKLGGDQVKVRLPRIETIIADLSNKHREVPNRIGIERWLALPLN